MSRRTNKYRARARQLANCLEIITRRYIDRGRRLADAQARIAVLEKEKESGWQKDGSITVHFGPDKQSYRGSDIYALIVRFDMSVLYRVFVTRASENFACLTEFANLQGDSIGYKAAKAIIDYIAKKE